MKSLSREYPLFLSARLSWFNQCAFAEQLHPNPYIIPTAGLRKMIDDGAAWLTDDVMNTYMKTTHNLLALPDWYHTGIHSGWFGFEQYNYTFFRMLQEAGGSANLGVEGLELIKQELIRLYHLDVWM